MFNLWGRDVVWVELEQYHLSFGLWKIFEKYLKNIPILDKWVRLEFSNGRCSPILFFHHLLLFWTPTSFGGSQWFWHLVSQMWGQMGWSGSECILLNVPCHWTMCTHTSPSRIYLPRYLATAANDAQTHTSTALICTPCTVKESRNWTLPSNEFLLWSYLFWMCHL